MTRRAKRVLAVASIAFVLALLPACQVAKAGTRCRPNGAWGRDSTYILHCQSGHWARTMTIARYAQLLLANATTTVPPAYTVRHHHTVFTDPTPVNSPLEGLIVTPTQDFRRPVIGAVACGGAAMNDPTNYVARATLSGPDHTSLTYTVDWVENVGNGPQGLQGCRLDTTLHASVSFVFRPPSDPPISLPFSGNINFTLTQDIVT